MTHFVKLFYDPGAKLLIAEFHDSEDGFRAWKPYDSLPYVDGSRMHEDVVEWTKDGIRPRFSSDIPRS